MKSAPQITGCKRHSCTCSHQEYSLNPRVFSGFKKSLRLPIKGGARARVKGFTTFEVRTGFQRFFCLLFLRDLRASVVTLVFGDSIRFSDPPTISYMPCQTEI
jgi:hypothetical protein